ncbi:sodium-dependent transporter [Helicobacter turcicus]|uniref:Transporter n=1 Tax=Helicobacter turcicus TaxID=2867412 RepID=A0ABS7JNC9_9HELI|nr:sodium-dependent transporter [Helicobacter turcicus]MBX7490875.1 sodium-dependent transporter [Helicobacter turcicus]MBX7545729.1 sodium-dependent transporter [Helicobacter turcicus]
MRHSWSSSLTYILVTAGATIGFGATWRFPYLVGQNGGGAYVLVFIIAMLLIGIPMILVENVIGRRAHKNVVDAFDGEYQHKDISKTWKIIGYMGLIGCFGIIAYYMVLGGRVLVYITSIVLGNLDLTAPITKEITKDFYKEHISNSTWAIGFYTAVFVLFNYAVLVKGIANGIEKAAKLLMPLLLICLMSVVARNLTLDGAYEGVHFYLYPDFSKITAELFIQVLGQVFFALSLGFGVMITLSSYLNKQENLVKTATITGIVNTIIALLAGFMIFPSLFTFGLAPDSGERLVFEVLPIVFSKMYFGSVVAIGFFLLLLLAAFTTSITLYEPLITTMQEKLGLSRVSAVSWVLTLTFIAGNIPCIIDDNVFNAFDFISGNIFFVLTALGAAIFVGWILGDDAKEELKNGFNNKRIINAWFYYVKYFVPFLILVVFISGIF